MITNDSTILNPLVRQFITYLIMTDRSNFLYVFINRSAAEKQELSDPCLARSIYGPFYFL